MRYRITKYDPKFRNDCGHYTHNEWTSWSDIGKIYDGRLFAKDDYIAWEGRYIRVIEWILKANKIDELQIVDLEIPDVFCDNMSALEKKGLTLTGEAYELYRMIKGGERSILAQDVPDIIELMLREFFWCSLCYGAEAKIYTGYDYYMYYEGKKLSEEICKYIADQGLFIEHEDEGRWILVSS